MLAYILAIAIAISSLALYLTAFLFPDLHRKDDFLWSGVGLFYALVLWVCAGRITGGVLLGQTASVLLLSWFGWQTMLYRKAIARPDQQAEILKFSLLEWVEGKLKAKKPVISTPKKAVVKEETSTENIETDTKIEEKVVTKEPEKTEIKQEIISTEKVEKITELKTETEEIQVKQETIRAITETPKTELKTDKKGFSFSKLINKISAPFGKKTVSQENKPETKENVKTESLLETFKDEIWEEEEPIVENKTTEITTETIETIETIEKEPEKITVETTKIEEQIKKSEIVPSEKSIENATNLDEKEDKNEEKPETKSEKKEQESSDEDNPFKELTS